MSLKNTSYEVDNLIEAIDNFNVNYATEASFPNLVSAGLEVFLAIEVSDYAAYYKMNNETFELQHYRSLPEKHIKKSKKIFDKSIENGIVGDALNTGKDVNYTDDKENKHWIIFPMIVQKGPIGLIILCLKKSPFEIEQILIKLLSIFTSKLAFAIDNLELRDESNRTQSVLDQIVASRTINLVESKKEMSDKIENLKSNLLMTVPHEVRTPLNQILGFSRFLKENFSRVDFDDAAEMLDDVEFSAMRLQRLFENYLFYASLSIIATNVMEVERLRSEQTHFADPVINEKVISVANLNGRHNDLELDINDGNPAISEVYLAKIVEELTDNTMKFSDTGSKIQISSGIENNSYFIIFEDHGHGMTDKQIDNIDAYIQFDRKVYEQQGSGLGLSIVRRLLDIHEGKMVIDSQPDKYTRIKVQLPLANNAG